MPVEKPEITLGIHTYLCFGDSLCWTILIAWFTTHYLCLWFSITLSRMKSINKAIIYDCGQLTTSSSEHGNSAVYLKRPTDDDDIAWKIAQIQLIPIKYKWFSWCLTLFLFVCVKNVSITCILHFFFKCTVSFLLKCLKLKGLCGKTWGGFYCEAFNAEAVGFFVVCLGEISSERYLTKLKRKKLQPFSESFYLSLINVLIIIVGNCMKDWNSSAK